MQMIMIGGTPAERQLKELSEFANEPENLWRHEPVPKDVSDKYHRTISVKNVFDEETLVYDVIFTISNGIPPSTTKMRHATIIGHGFLPDQFALLTICVFLGFRPETRQGAAHFIDKYPYDKNGVVVFQSLEEIPLNQNVTLITLAEHGKEK